MRLTIAAIGRERDAHAKALAEGYYARLPWTVTVRELEVKKPLAGPARMVAEAELLAAALPKGAPFVALDERGKEPGSVEFAQTLAKLRDDGGGEVGFVIGGADGLDPALRARACYVLAFGRLTWPHLLVRVMLAEQLYRAHTILTNHPYHREG